MRRLVYLIIFLFFILGPSFFYGEETLKIGVSAMMAPKATVRYYSGIIEYIGKKTGKPVEMIQRETYDEMDDLLRKGKVKIAFICVGPYIKNKEEFGVELLVAPQSHGKAFYQAYIIVHKDSPVNSLSDLRGKSFAFTDPKSNTGQLVPTFMIAKKFNTTPEKFFSRIIYTNSHDRSIEAVAKKLVDGASVNSLIYDYASKKNPVYTSLTKIIEKSPPYGLPPLVVTKDFDPELREKIKNILLNMHNDPEGRKVLDAIMIDRFIIPKDSDYDPVREMENWLRKQKNKND
ncbi:MAG: phosphate/phosphite/phosphonate ABC transporter substrate-binding protein [Thermodesulfovibrionales bacterium]|nr:phosphate/phosphite/phosphonate ABC transporter substrate-binding protein [Thermodesulfovibrionales bacterium]